MNKYEHKLVGPDADHNIIWIGSARLSRFVRRVAVIIGLAMIILPIALLYFHVHAWGKWSKLGLITGFTILFTAFLKISCKIKTQETLSYSSR
jgi:hypothetical protein